MIKVKKLYSLILFLAVVTPLLVRAQLYPSQAVFTLSPPFPIYLSDYANPNANNLSVRLIYRDQTIGTRNIKLKFSITGQNFQASNISANVRMPEFTITAGQPLLLNQSDIYPYFLAENLDIPPSLYSQPLPEGMYTFGVEILDAFSNRPISGVLSSVPYWFVVNDPPIINLPLNGSKIMVTNPQNVVFQWTPRHKQATFMEYEFTLTEIIKPEGFDGNMQQLFFSQPPYYQTITNNTTLLFGPGEPPLIEGRHYMARIQARAKKGFEQIGIFRNDGFSEVINFQYTNPVSQLIEIQDNITERITINTDRENYFTPEYNQIIKQTQKPLLKAPGTLMLEKYYENDKKLKINDTLRIVDLAMVLVANNQVAANISIPDFGTKVVKLFFNDSLKVNSKNEVNFGGLNLYPTLNKIALDDSIKSKIVPNKTINNKPSLFGSLLLLEEAKMTNNITYHQIRALAMKSTGEIREINLKLNAFLAYLKDKTSLMARIINNYQANLVFKDLNLKISQEKKQTDQNIKNLQEFLKNMILIIKIIIQI